MKYVGNQVIPASLEVSRRIHNSIRSVVLSLSEGLDENAKAAEDRFYRSETDGYGGIYEAKCDFWAKICFICPLSITFFYKNIHKYI